MQIASQCGIALKFLCTQLSLSASFLLGQANCKPNGCQIDIASLGERIVAKNYDEGEDMLHLQLPSLDASFLVVLCQNNARQGGGAEVAINRSRSILVY